MTSLALAALPPVSSLESYVSAVNAIPMLTPERETALGRRLKESNDLTAAGWIQRSTTSTATFTGLNRYVRIQLVGTNVLSLAEVNIKIS